MPPPSLTPLAGGWSGETFLADSGAERTVVRVYGGRSRARGPAAPEVDAAVLALVRGLLPVPRVLEVRRADPDTDAPGLLVVSLEPGERGDLVLERLLAAGDDAGLRRVGEALGRVAGRLACMPQPRAGALVDGDLRVEAFDGSPLDALLAAPPAHWTPREREGLQEVAARAQRLLDLVGRRSLVHSDLNPKNVLLDPDTLAVTAVLDWEFAHAGHPATDLGNLLRFDRAPAYADAVLAAYADQVPDAGAHEDLLDRARAADLQALADLTTRRGQDPVADRAHDLLRAIAATGDLHARP